jgi:hypothetical protein
MGKAKNISSKVRHKTRVSTLPTLIQYSAKILSQSSKVRERNKRNTNRKGRIQLTPFADDMVIYLKTLKILQKNPKPSLI